MAGEFSLTPRFERSQPCTDMFRSLFGHSIESSACADAANMSVSSLVGPLSQPTTGLHSPLSSVLGASSGQRAVSSGIGIGGRMVCWAFLVSPVPAAYPLDVLDHLVSPCTPPRCHIHRFLQVQLWTSGLLWSVVATPGIRTWAMYLLRSLSIRSCKP